ncbi:LOW QUALITY PROTEIN: hypothetical protein V1477_004078 [Vespula maculifrons]|uniref:Uncharacterized protein n=1 Tax=Vespula maculifrons TaxID=7453 RepID=A0ABD2CQJ9_VESMC
MPADISECPSNLPEREKRNLSTPEKDSLNTRIKIQIPPWSLADGTDVARGNTRTNGDSTLKSTIRDAFRFGSFRFLSELEMYKTPLTDRSTVHTVGFRHLETRPVVSIFRSENQNLELEREKRL